MAEQISLKNTGKRLDRVDAGTLVWVQRKYLVRDPEGKFWVRRDALIGTEKGLMALVPGALRELLGVRRGEEFTVSRGTKSLYPWNTVKVSKEAIDPSEWYPVVNARY
jgi:hypothetical protein